MLHKVIFCLLILKVLSKSSRFVFHRLAAARNVYGVTLGGIMGHAICTGIAVLGGKQFASHINENMVAVSSIGHSVASVVSGECWICPSA